MNHDYQQGVSDADWIGCDCIERQEYTTLRHDQDARESRDAGDYKSQARFMADMDAADRLPLGHLKWCPCCARLRYMQDDQQICSECDMEMEGE